MRYGDGACFYARRCARYICAHVPRSGLTAHAQIVQLKKKKMAEQQGPSCSGSCDQQAYPAKEMNGVVQVLGWLMIKHKFYNRQLHATLHTALNGRW